MGLLDNYTGIGMSPRPKWGHQMVMRRALHYMYDELEQQNLQILSEATVTDDWDDLAPDLVVFDEHFIPRVIIEITTHRELRKIIRKCDELIDRFPDAEYFAYDYEKQVLYCYNLGKNVWLSSNDYDIHSAYLTESVLSYLKG